MILQSDSTELGIALRKHLGDDGCSRLFAIMDGYDEYDGKPIPRFLKEIVSSQLDVDRMDYLVRDQHNTGAQIGGFDIDRVFRALRVGKDGGIYAKAWGLPAIEAYLVTRYHMYNQVYYHKVNALTQCYLIGMLERGRSLANQDQLQLSPALTNMLIDENLSVEDYIRLTDADINVVLNEWSEHDDKLLSSFAGKLLSRRDFHKSIRIAELDVEMAEILRPHILEILEESGYTEDDLITATIRKKGYKPYVEGITLEDGRDVCEHRPWFDL